MRGPIVRAMPALVALAVLLMAVRPADAQTQAPAEQDQGQHDHAGHEPAAPEARQAAPGGELPSFIPRLTDDDRRAAFPDVEGHVLHGRSIHAFVLIDRIEWQATDRGGLLIDTNGWIGGDRDRLLFRVDGETADDDLEHGQAEILYGRHVARWWDFVAGVRQDVRPGPAQTWAAVGVQGVAPYWFAIEATAYVGASGRTQVSADVEYDLLFTNRLILQPRLEVVVSGRSDPERGIGRGINSTDAGFRLRYEFRREFAPYVGIAWKNKWGATADLAEASGDDTGGARFVAGLRLWF